MLLPSALNATRFLMNQFKEFRNKVTMEAMPRSKMDVSFLYLLGPVGLDHTDACVEFQGPNTLREFKSPGEIYNELLINVVNLCPVLFQCFL